MIIKLINLLYTDEIDAFLAGKLQSAIEKGTNERIRASTVFPVARPPDWQVTDYVQLREILEAGCKISPTDDKGYSEPRPVFNYNTGTIIAGSYELVTPAKSIMLSSLYVNYIDEPAILFKEGDNKIMLFLSGKNESLAIKGSGITVYKLKDEYKDLYSIEFIYLMMKNQNFAHQFKDGMNSKCLLEGWIPELHKEKQKKIAAKIRTGMVNELEIALDILK